MFSPGIKLPFTNNNNNNNIVSDKYAPESSYILYFDGCCKGNPGAGGAGAVIYKDGLEIWADCIFVGKKITNNIAEYTGLIIGLKKAITLGINNLTIKGDSLLIIKQMLGEYKVNSENLVELYKTAKELEKLFDTVEFIHVYRNDNKRADALSNQGLLKI